MAEIKANDPSLRSWVDVPPKSDFPIQNLPLGIFRTEEDGPRVGIAIGDLILDLKVLSTLGYLRNMPFDPTVYSSNVLNPLLLKGRDAVRELRNRISELLDDSNEELKSKAHHINQSFVAQSDAEMLMPVKVGDYTDFYSSEDHARNVGTMFRDPDNALLPNWKHIPVGYHGRASSIVVSGTAFHRPKGQTKTDDSDSPVFNPTRLLDFELEMAFVTYQGKPLGQSISTDEAEEFIAGLVLFNDWSARDIQKWEYVPLGPFLAKNFVSTISPWLVLLDAFAPYKVDGPKQEPKVLPYLEYSGSHHYDINLEVHIVPENGKGMKVCGSNYKYMYWNMAQQLAHHTVNGCNINCGDMMASGTISGPTEDSYGSMLELSWRGTKPITMPDGSERKFILDGDTVVMRGFAEKDGIRIGFGQASAKVLPVN